MCLVCSKKFSFGFDGSHLDLMILFEYTQVTCFFACFFRNKKCNFQIIFQIHPLTGICRPAGGVSYTIIDED